VGRLRGWGVSFTHPNVIYYRYNLNCSSINFLIIFTTSVCSTPSHDPCYNYSSSGFISLYGGPLKEREREREREESWINKREHEEKKEG
jgi:hypothetical protein